MFREIGTRMDNRVVDIKRWVYGTRLYGVYCGRKVPKYIKNIRNIDSLNRFLSICLDKKWITEEKAQSYRKEWLDMMKSDNDRNNEGC